METRPIAFKCIVERIHLSIYRLHAWQDVLSLHAHSSTVQKERSTRDLRQRSTRTKLVESMCFTCQRSILIIMSSSTFENAVESARSSSHGR